MWYHAVILDIFRPFLQRELGGSLKLRTFSSTDSTPDAAFAASVDELKSLVLLYRSSAVMAPYSIIWHPALLYLGNALLSRSDESDPEWYAYFLVCIYGYASLRRRFRIAGSLARGLLSMALRRHRISSVHVRTILADFGEGEEGVRALFAGDLGLAESDPYAARVETLAHQLDDLALFREFTNEE